MANTIYEKAARGRRLKVLLLAMLIVLAVAVPMRDVTARFSRVYDRLSGKLEAVPVSGLLNPSGFSSADAQECDAAFPAHGRSHRFSDVAASHWTKLQSRLFVSNEHAYPVMLVITDPQWVEEYQAIALYPGRGAQIQVPVGDYGMVALTGRSWCNLAQGFVDGAEIRGAQSLSIQSGQVARLRLMSYGSGPGDLMFSSSQALGVGPGSSDGIEGHGAMVLQRMGMHYAVEGSINGIPLTFMVDTGATVTTVSREFAREAGLRDCVPHRVSTANGIATACKATASELTLGQFRLQNVAVDIMEKPGEHLLGMNVIGRFRLEQQGDVMRLSAR